MGAVVVVGAVVVDVVDKIEVGGPDGSDADSSEEQAKLNVHAPSTTTAPQRRFIWLERASERFSRGALSIRVFYTRTPALLPTESATMKPELPGSRGATTFRHG